MRTVLMVEDGDGKGEADKGQEEAGGAGREQRRPDQGAAAADETRCRRGAHAEAQAQAFRGMEQTRVMRLELVQAKADVSKLQAEAKLKDKAFQAFQSKESLWQAVIRSKDEQLSSLLVSKDAVI
jgi:hypothetical protein